MRAVISNRGLIALAASLIAAAASPAGAQSVAGVWQQIDPGTGKKSALVTFTENRGVFSGALSKLFPEPGDDPNPLCRKCPDDKKNKPLLGLVFIEGMRRSGLAYEDGTILDPETGTVYNANMQLSPDGNELAVRGYVGIPLLGQSQIWRRVR